MPSSISSSESRFDAEPVILRQVPPGRWPRTALFATLVLLAALAGWEGYWRSQGVVPGYGNSDGQWAEVRRKVDASRPDATVFIGSSRTQFDLGLAVWQEETGVEPIQLALEGSNPLPLLTDLAEDEDFRGLLLVGITPPLIFQPGIGLREGAVEHYRTETPSERLGTLLSYPLERTFAFYSYDYKLFAVLARQPWWPERAGLPYQTPVVRKIEIMHRSRESDLWTRVESDPEYNAIVTSTWQAILEHLPPPPPPEVAAKAFEALLAQVTRDVAAIRARGGEVVFLRPPSSGWFREFEARVAPRGQVWESLLTAADAVGIHFEDYPELQVPTPEWSHISVSSKDGFTRGVVRALRARLAERGVHRPELGS
ncbi:MAG: hypothetical protein U0974_10250 [Gemmatimonadales bacterium]|nr:hypothetical protein [Gemmatimonadales bacterium]MDZ4390097.1 hypothetical protein [Gemmatimonadales bacterium]